MPQSLIRQSRPFEVEFAKLRCGPAFGENLATKATHCRAVFCLWRSRDHWGCLLLSRTTPFQPYPYADDWIYQTPLQYKSLHQYITWAFSQHVDHRIPVQLASNFLILRASGFDFRYLVGLNFALACLMTVLLLYIAQRYRGYQMFGDVIIPLTTLSFGAGYTIWGFQFQFLSSTFFLTLFIFCCVLFESSGRQVYLQAAAGSLLLCSLCGMNGLVASSCATVAMMGWLLLCRVSKVPVRQTRAIYLLRRLRGRGYRAVGKLETIRGRECRALQCLQFRALHLLHTAQLLCPLFIY